MRKYEVGQRVWVYSINDRGNQGPKEGTVVKVGRTLVTVDRGWYGRGDTTYRMETGHRNDQYGHDYILTDDEKADRERRQVPLAYLRDKRIYDLPRQLSTAALERIVEIIRADLGERE